MQKDKPISTEEVMKLVSSPAGQQLIQMLKNADSHKMQQAVSQANAGNMAGAQNTLSDFLASPQVQALLKELGRQP